jgi:hypothetical protein
MNSRSFSMLAAVIFALGATVQLIRGISGWSISFQGSEVPVLASYIAFVILGGLAWLGWSASNK